MRRTAVSAFIALALVASSAAGQTQERAGLRWRLEKDAQARYKLTWALEQKIDMGGNEIAHVLDVEMALDQKVLEKAGDVATLEATIGAIKARVSMGPFGEMSFDSGDAGAADETNPFLWLKDAIGKKFTFKMTATGDVTEVQGGDALQEELSAVLQKKLEERMAQGGGNDPMGGMGMGMMDPAMLTANAVIVFGDGTMKSALDVVNQVLPEATTAQQGDAYSRTMEESIPAMGTMTYTQNFKVNGVAGDAVRVGWSAADDIKVTRDPNAGMPGGRGGMGGMGGMGGGGGGMGMEKMEVTRKAVNGSASFDGARGRLIDSEAVHEIDMEGPLPPMVAAMMGPQGKNAKMRMGIVLTLRYVEDTGAAPAQPTPTPAPGNGNGNGGRSSF